MDHVGTPYRSVGEPSGAEKPPAEVAYVSSDADRGASSRRAAFQALLVAALVGGGAYVLGHPVVTYVVIGAAVAFGAWSWYRAPDVGGVVLRVVGGRLEVSSRRARRALFGVRLADLDDVLLDTRTISKVTMGRTAIPALRHIEAKAGPEIDVARIALVPAGDTPAFFLTEDHMRYDDCIEWIARIRRFLRAHGWRPVDERE